MLSRSAGEDDGREPVEEVAGLLLDSLALVVLGRARRGSVAAQDTRFRLLYAAGFSVDESNGRRWEEDPPRGRVGD